MALDTGGHVFNRVGGYLIEYATKLTIKFKKSWNQDVLFLKFCLFLNLSK